MRKPVIAAVAGFALGGGCELALQCNLIIAADNAKFGQPEIKLGIIPGIGGMQRFTRAVGKAKAMDIILTGRTMDAEEAERSGLVARIVPRRERWSEGLDDYSLGHLNGFHLHSRMRDRYRLAVVNQDCCSSSPTQYVVTIAAKHPPLPQRVDAVEKGLVIFDEQ